MTNVGGAVRRFDLLPIAMWQCHMSWLTQRYREQAPSHIYCAHSRLSGGIRSARYRAARR